MPGKEEKDEKSSAAKRNRMTVVVVVVLIDKIKKKERGRNVVCCSPNRKNDIQEYKAIPSQKAETHYLNPPFQPLTQPSVLRLMPSDLFFLSGETEEEIGGPGKGFFLLST